MVGTGDSMEQRAAGSIDLGPVHGGRLPRLAVTGSPRRVGCWYQRAACGTFAAMWQAYRAALWRPPNSALCTDTRLLAENRDLDDRSAQFRGRFSPDPGHRDA